MIRYTSRFTEHNIDIGIISNVSLCQIYKAVSGKYVLYEMFEEIYNTKVPSWTHSLAIFAIFVWNGQKSWPV